MAKLSRISFRLLISTVVLTLGIHPTYAAGQPARVTHNARMTIPCGEWMDSATAELVARALVRLDVVEQAEQAVAALTIVRLGLDNAQALPALTFMTLRPIVSEPPRRDGSVTLEADVFVPLAALPEMVQAEMGKSDELDVRTDMLARMRNVGEEARNLILQGMENNALPDESSRERLSYLARQLHALERLDEMIEEFGNEWQPAAQAAEALEQAIEKDPDSALLHLGLAETLLRLDRAHEAIDAASRALQLDAELARGYYVRGLAQLRVNLVSLAVADFGQAIARRQDRAAWWRARAAARLVQHDFDNMCADLYTACSLGDCGGLAEVRNRDLCLQ